MPAEPARKPRAVQAEVERLLASERDDRALRDRLDQIAQEPGFRGVPLPVWAPALYRRDRVLFRPFILSHFSTATFFGVSFKAVPWRAYARDLDAWLQEVDRDDDVQLFRRLYQWRIAGAWRNVEKEWRRDLLTRMRAAATRAERQGVLARFDLPGALTEEIATELYTQDAAVARRFILSHLPFGWAALDAKRVLWRPLYELAHRLGDAEFGDALFRRQAPIAEWRTEALRLCRDETDPDRLTSALEDVHPQGWNLKGQGPVFVELLRARGREVLSYVARHLPELRRLWFRDDGHRPLLDLAREHGWWDLWAEVLRTGARPDAFDQAILDLVRDRALPEADIRRRLLLLSGVSRELHFGPFSLAAVHLLKEATAVALYERFPDLVRTAFRLHVGARYGHGYPDLVERVRAAGDEALLDYLASRLLVVYPEKKHLRAAERMADDFEALAGAPAAFARRAAAVLGQIPAYSVFDYARLVRENRLARLLFERSPDAYLADPTALRDLLEAPEIHVQALAFRALGRDDERARAAAAANVDLLQAALFRPLHRRTRLLAFAALENAASRPETARRVAARAREALALPDQRYPKEQLFGLLGRLLHRWPELRQPHEQPVVHRAAVPA
jgi:hypothetical protein